MENLGEGHIKQPPWAVVVHGGCLAAWVWDSAFCFFSHFYFGLVLYIAFFCYFNGMTVILKQFFKKEHMAKWNV